VRLSADGSWVHLEVEDTVTSRCRKIPKAPFDPLAKRERFVGTALGLAISKRIAEEVGGRIDAGKRGTPSERCSDSPLRLRRVAETEVVDELNELTS